MQRGRSEASVLELGSDVGSEGEDLGGVRSMAEVGVGVGIYFEAKLGLVVVLS